MKKLKQYEHKTLTDIQRELVELAISQEVLSLNVKFHMGYYNGVNNQEELTTCCMIGRVEEAHEINRIPDEKRIDLSRVRNEDYLDELIYSAPSLVSSLWEGTSYNESKYLEHLYKYALEYGVPKLSSQGLIDYDMTIDLQMLMENLLQLNPLED